MSGAGYVEQEFFVSGSAANQGVLLCQDNSDTSTLKSAPFNVRIVVYRPTSPKRFNGTAIIEWENTTATTESDPMFHWLDSYVLRSGYMYIKAMAQEGSLGSDARYDVISHPGDPFASDIFTQEVRALFQRKGSDPTGGLKVKRVIAVGNSQSGDWLHDYEERFAARTKLIDGFLMDADVSCDREFTKPLPRPGIELLSEDGFNADPIPKLKNYRLWEVVGASHTDMDEARNQDTLNVQKRLAPGRRTWAEQLKVWAARTYGEEGLSGSATCAATVAVNEFPRRYAVAAAVAALDRWIQTGEAPYLPTRVPTYPSGALPMRDTYGNTLGGVRLPPIVHPVAQYNGMVCGKLTGVTIPLDPAQLSLLYPTHQDYVNKMAAATKVALQQRIMVPLDAIELMNRVRASSIGGLG